MSTSIEFEVVTRVMDEVRFMSPNQHPHELFRFLAFVHSLKPKTIIEIGVEKGATALALRKIAPEAHLILIDINRPDLLRYIESHPGETTFFQGRSQDLAPTVQKLYDPKTTLVFVDGDHSYSAICEDARLYPAAIQAFHDIHWVAGNFCPRGESGDRFYSEHKDCCFAGEFNAGWAGIGIREPARCHRDELKPILIS